MNQAEKLARERARRHHGSLAVDFLRLILSEYQRDQTLPILEECGLLDDPPHVDTLVAAIRAAGNGKFPEGRTGAALADLGMALISIGVAVCNQTCERFDATSVPGLVDNAPQIADACEAAFDFRSDLGPSDRLGLLKRAIYGT